MKSRQLSAKTVETTLVCASLILLTLSLAPAAVADPAITWYFDCSVDPPTITTNVVPPFAATCATGNQLGPINNLNGLRQTITSGTSSARIFMFGTGTVQGSYTVVDTSDGNRVIASGTFSGTLGGNSCNAAVSFAGTGIAAQGIALTFNNNFRFTISYTVTGGTGRVCTGGNNLTRIMIESTNTPIPEFGVTALIPASIALLVLLSLRRTRIGKR